MCSSSVVYIFTFATLIHLSENIVLVCCDFCSNAYHEKCLDVNASTLPDRWQCPKCIVPERRKSKRGRNKEEGNNNCNVGQESNDNAEGPYLP